MAAAPKKQSLNSPYSLGSTNGGHTQLLCDGSKIASVPVRDAANILGLVNGVYRNGYITGLSVAPEVPHLNEKTPPLNPIVEQPKKILVSEPRERFFENSSNPVSSPPISASKITLKLFFVGLFLVLILGVLGLLK